MNNQAFARADVRNNRVAGNRTAALGKGDQHAIRAFNRQMVMADRRRLYRHGGGFTLLQVFCYDDAHGVTEANFGQQIVKRCQLHTVKFALNVLWRNFGQLAAATERVIKQASPEANGIVALEVFQQLANFGARFRADDKVQPRGVRTSARRGDDLHRLAAGERLRQGIWLAVDARADAGMADIGMHRVGEVHRRRASGQFDDAPFRGENVNLIREQIGFHALNKFK